ncbi:hypothetical protein D187_009106 [Cystobacter fuscus DSM 2262]|jgi:hypothetical protein|uniref:Uncharacterized protein n=1 Tax=Cystobacter fuscus (strain ATCC 25194 / DSM 2262 / NBRC 100088 / M29) TaxID=1242864 RepID=S9NTM5_CYSF2|nr:hypothetical protein [Cystobacter fuscus]EPX55495.1 hypothetical protein D187_009106 [Cystobacter fuscus DSM 2262]WNG28324.1 hypothetical protein F0U62_33190 [Cystobacter fuscus]
MPGCARCGGRLDIVGTQVGRRETCPHCGAALRNCRNCRHFDEAAAKQCKEPFAEVPSDKDVINFCDLFQMGEGGRPDADRRDALLSAAEALFKKR